MRMAKRDNFYFRQIDAQSSRINPRRTCLPAVKNKFRPPRLNKKAQPVFSNERRIRGRAIFNQHRQFHVNHPAEKSNRALKLFNEISLNISGA